MMPVSSSVYRTLILVGLAYVAFVIYGSLVPLDFHSRGWEDARLAFKNLPPPDLGMDSRSDWGANFLLTVPLTFIWLGILWHPANAGMRLLASAAVLATALALSISIEFAQLFFPPRVSSLNDIIAQGIGSCAGIALWWVYGEKFLRWLARWQAAQTSTGLAGHLLPLYLFILFGYGLLPLDLTLSPVEIYHKWQEGRVILMPFSFVFASPQEALYGLISDAAIWAPVAFLWRLSSARTAQSILLRVVGAAALLEFLQLFVYSRISSVTEIITAAVGGLAGLLLAKRMNKKTAMPGTGASQRAGRPQRMVWLMIGVLWMTVIITIFWYPFNFHFYRELTGETLSGMLGIPLLALWGGSEYHAATQVLHKAGSFLPLGILLRLALPNDPSNKLRRLMKIGAFLLISLLALGIEAGQVFLPGKYPDSTDWLLETLGGVAGYLLIEKVKGKGIPAAIPAGIGKLGSLGMLPSMVVSLLLLTAASWIATHSPAVPYNVRKLLVPEYPLVSLGLLSCFIYWTVAFPAWFAVRQKQVRMMWPFAAVMLLHAGMAWVLLRLAVPVGMIEKIAASPILGWSWEWELMGRFIALFGVLSIGLTAGAMAVLAFWRKKSDTPFFYWLANAALLLPLLYWVVVENAATDNLTELMAHGGSPAAGALLLLGLIILCSAGSALAALLSGNFRRSATLLALFAILSFPLAYLTISAGTEPFVIKYGKVFSALQFLLSSDRQHYAGTEELLIRYAVFHAACIGAIAFVQRPFFRTLDQPAVERGPARRHRVEDDGDPGEAA